MSDEPRTPSRRERRQAAESSGSDAPATSAASGGQAPEIRAGFAFTTEIPVGQMAAAGFGDVPGFQTGGTPTVSPAPAVPAAPTDHPGQMGTITPGFAHQDGSQGGDAASATTGGSRRDRRRLERLDHPMETWSAEEESSATGQVPTMSPQAIANEEALARQVAATAQADARIATGEVPLVGAPTGPDGRPMIIAPSPDGGVPPALQHLFPPGPVQVPTGQPGMPPMGAMPGQPPAAPSRPPQPQGPSIDSHGRLVAPGGAAPVVVPSLVDGPPRPGAAGGPPMPPVPGVPQQVPGQQGGPAGPQYAPQTAAFEALVGGGAASGPATGPKPPTMPVSQVQGMQMPGAPVPVVQQGPFAPPGTGAPGMPPGVAFPGPGTQGIVIPGTATLRTTGSLRAVPGTGAIPRPVVEVHPAGGVRHFGWVQLLLLAAAAFALGVVVWNVASRGS